MFLILVNILMLVVGCFLDTIAAITILVPILLPIVLKLGIDPVHFGLIVPRSFAQSLSDWLADVASGLLRPAARRAS